MLKKKLKQFQQFLVFFLEKIIKVFFFQFFFTVFFSEFKKNLLWINLPDFKIWESFLNDFRGKKNFFQILFCCPNKKTIKNFFSKNFNKKSCKIFFSRILPSIFLYLFITQNFEWRKNITQNLTNINKKSKNF